MKLGYNQKNSPLISMDKYRLSRINPKECNSGYSIGNCTPMVIAALFTIAKLWK
jgi:hypothetical protein